MQARKTTRQNSAIQSNARHEHFNIDDSVQKCWSRISPFWPLQNLTATNPLGGFEDIPFEHALKLGKSYFQQKSIPSEMENVNIQSIKWLQVFLDENQAVISMPLKSNGLLKSIKPLLLHDKKVHGNVKEKKQWISNLPDNANSVIAECFLALGIPHDNHQQFLLLMLTTLPGWASYLKYLSSWQLSENLQLQKDYLALRMIITTMMWSDAKSLLAWHQTNLLASNPDKEIEAIKSNELKYKEQLIQSLERQKQPHKKTADAQFIFCIDVRSEPFRRKLEAQGNYETFGYAGFFGVPVSIENDVTNEKHSSCPVLIKPSYDVKESPINSVEKHRKGYQKYQKARVLYKKLKYTFASPFAVVETLGILSGLWMFTRSIFPGFAKRIQQKITKVYKLSYDVKTNIDMIPLDDQVTYAANSLRMIGLTENFAPIIVVTAHGSSTQNNAYATSLDCGACGGRHGSPNARILAEILNSPDVRFNLKAMDISIPDNTIFIAAKHDTTTDDLELFDALLSENHKTTANNIKKDLHKAKVENAYGRAIKLGIKNSKNIALSKLSRRSHDWAQVRPEWGLARNASLIIGPRWLTKNVDLDGRSFLHSYDWSIDKSGDCLTTILTAPMIVAQWINYQYFFSSLDNVAYGGGSKVTKNITGKFGIIQGNASDLMHGLALQSVYKSDNENYHEPLRLLTVVHAPHQLISKIISGQPILQKLFGNGWVKLVCVDPLENKSLQLERSLSWTTAN